MEVKSKTEILIEEWDEGSDTNKRRLEKDRLLIETFAYHCMEKLEKELRGEK